jgi:hypothetical protein
VLPLTPGSILLVLLVYDATELSCKSESRARNIYLELAISLCLKNYGMSVNKMNQLMSYEKTHFDLRTKQKTTNILCKMSSYRTLKDVYNDMWLHKSILYNHALLCRILQQ